MRLGLPMGAQMANMAEPCTVGRAIVGRIDKGKRLMAEVMVRAFLGYLIFATAADLFTWYVEHPLR